MRTYATLLFFSILMLGNISAQTMYIRQYPEKIETILNNPDDKSIVVILDKNAINENDKTMPVNIQFPDGTLKKLTISKEKGHFLKNIPEEAKMSRFLISPDGKTGILSVHLNGPKFLEVYNPIYLVDIATMTAEYLTEGIASIWRCKSFDHFSKNSENIVTVNENVVEYWNIKTKKRIWKTSIDGLLSISSNLDEGYVIAVSYNTKKDICWLHKISISSGDIVNKMSFPDAAVSTLINFKNNHVVVVEKRGLTIFSGADMKVVKQFKDNVSIDPQYVESYDDANYIMQTKYNSKDFSLYETNTAKYIYSSGLNPYRAKYVHYFKSDGSSGDEKNYDLSIYEHDAYCLILDKNNKYFFNNDSLVSSNYYHYKDSKREFLSSKSELFDPQILKNNINPEARIKFLLTLDNKGIFKPGIIESAGSLTDEEITMFLQKSKNPEILKYIIPGIVQKLSLMKDTELDTLGVEKCAPVYNALTTYNSKKLYETAAIKPDMQQLNILVERLKDRATPEYYMNYAELMLKAGTIHYSGKFAGKNTLEEAMKYFDAAAKKAPKNPETPFMIGKAYYDYKMWDQAIEYFNKSLALDQNYIFAWNAIYNTLTQKLKNTYVEQYSEEQVKKTIDFIDKYLAILGCVEQQDARDAKENRGLLQFFFEDKQGYIAIREARNKSIAEQIELYKNLLSKAETGTNKYLVFALSNRLGDAYATFEDSVADKATGETGFDLLIKMHQKAISTGLASDMSYFFLGQLLITKKKFADANIWIEKGIASCPTSERMKEAKSRLKINEGLKYMKEENYAKAFPLFDAYMKMNPGIVNEALAYAAVSALGAGKYKEANSYFSKIKPEEIAAIDVLQYFPNWEQMKIYAAKPVPGKAPKVESKVKVLEEISDLYSVGVELYKKEKYNEAIEPITKACQMYDQEQYKQGQASAYYGLAIVYHNLNNLAKAKEYYIKCIEFGSKQLSAWNSLISFYNKDMEYTQSEKLLTEADKIFPNEYKIKERWCDFWYFKGLDEYDRKANTSAIDYLQKALTYVERGNVLCGLGAAHMAMNNKSKAKECFKRAIEIEPQISKDFPFIIDIINNTNISTSNTMATKKYCYIAICQKTLAGLGSTRTYQSALFFDITAYGPRTEQEIKNFGRSKASLYLNGYQITSEIVDPANNCLKCKETIQKAMVLDDFTIYSETMQ